MSFGELVYSPATWGVLSFCLVGGWYAKRELFTGTVTGLVAPVFLAFTWGVVYLALALPYAALAIVQPEMVAKLGEAYAGFPGYGAFLLHPATLITAALYLAYCRTERSTGPVVATTEGPKREQLRCRRALDRHRRARLAFAAEKWRRARIRGLRVLDRRIAGAKFHSRLCRKKSKSSSSPAAPGVSTPLPG